MINLHESIGPGGDQTLASLLWSLIIRAFEFNIMGMARSCANVIHKSVEKRTMLIAKSMKNLVQPCVLLILV